MRAEVSPEAGTLGTCRSTSMFAANAARRLNGCAAFPIRTAIPPTPCVAPAATARTWSGLSIPVWRCGERPARRVEVDGSEVARRAILRRSLQLGDATSRAGIRSTPERKTRVPGTPASTPEHKQRVPGTLVCRQSKPRPQRPAGADSPQALLVGRGSAGRSPEETRHCRFRRVAL